MIHHNIYIKYNFNTMGSKLGYYIPLPLTTTLLSMLFNKNSTPALPQCSAKLNKKWICQSYGTLQLPCSLIRSVVLRLHLHMSNGTIWNFSLGSTMWLSCIRTPPSPRLHALVHTTKSFPSLGESFSSSWNISNAFGNQQYLCSSPKQ